MHCNRCGHANPAGSNFCSSCGAALEGDENTVTMQVATAEPADEEVGVVLDELPAGSGVLVVKRGPNAGSRFLLDADVIRAGRHPDSDIFLDDITVSRRHAEFRRAGGGGYEVHDAGSLNGTYLNRERVDDALLSNGDEVQIGKFKLVYLAAGDS